MKQDLVQSVTWHSSLLLMAILANFIDVAISSGLQSTGDSPFLHDRASDVTTYLDATAKSICEQEFTSKQTATGTFSSPDYPQPYPEYAFCKYVFRGQVHERVQLVFTKFDLHYPAGDPNDPHDCDEDTPDMLTVTVFGSSKPLKISNYCGKKRPPMLMSSSNSMELVFTSGALSNSTGFFGHFSFITNFGITNGEQESDSDCRFIFRSSSRSTSGTFTSPNFPGLYPRETECHYLFYGQEGDRVDINFVHFNVEGITPSCLEETQSDYIEFSNFNIPLTDRKMIRLCGDQDHSRTITSDGNFFRVTFRSNEIFDASGFEATYQFINSKGSRSGKSTKDAGGDTEIRPVFKSTYRNITVGPGDNAVLKCKVENLGTKTVTWWKQDDARPLTIGMFPFTPDTRVTVDYNQRTMEWILIIQDVRPTDEGIYRCQISPKNDRHSYDIRLNVKTIQVSGTQYIEKGSSIQLVCNVTGKPDPPNSIDWYRGNNRVNSDTRNGIIITNKIETRVMVSMLVIKNSQPEDSGEYVCRSSDRESSSIKVHVLIGPNSSGDKHNIASVTSRSIHYATTFAVFALFSN